MADAAEAQLPGLLVAYAAIATMAVVPIYIGSHLSLHMSKEDKEEAMTSKDAAMFPIIGSGVLFGLYLLFKLFNEQKINMLLSFYFLALGFFSLQKTLGPLIKPIFRVLDHSPLPAFTIPAIPYILEKPIPMKPTLNDAVVAVVCSFFIASYIMTKNWILNNLLGLSFSIQGIALFNLGTYSNGAILLGGLFLYDIFWVFGTDVMVTVAKSFDAPIKLLFPKDLFAEELKHSMLGLGDIVIPGVVIALLLRYDYRRSGNRIGDKKSWKKPYFNATLLGYFVGLVLTVFVMHTFQAAQPALLYLVPTCLGSSIFTAVRLGDLSGLLAYTEEEETKTDTKTE